MKLKICGVQTIAEAEKLADMNVDFVGLNFVPTSSRRIDLQTGKEIAARLKSTPVRLVVLFQNQPLERVHDYVREIDPDYVQLHGQETDEYIAAVGAPVIKSITSDDQTFPVRAKYYLLDRTTRGQGSVIDVKAAVPILNAYPDRIFLAGGLTPENLADALAEVEPFAVDIAGGVRTNNVLDFEKIEKVLKIMREREP